MPSRMKKLIRKTKDACGIFNEATCKANCKMAATRANMMINKENATRVRLENEVAELIRNMKLEKARVKAEQVLQSEKTEMGLDVLETMLELLHNRTAMINASEHMPEDLRVPVATLMHCEGRLNIDELATVTDQLRRKWGDNFAEECLSPEGADAHPKIVDALSIYPPSELTIESCLTQICQKRGIPYLSAAKQQEELSIDELTSGTPPKPMNYGAGGPASMVGGPNDQNTHGSGNYSVNNPGTMNDGGMNDSQDNNNGGPSMIF